MFTIETFTIKKRKNSTFRPTPGTGLTLNVLLKEDTSVYKPTFLLKLVKNISSLSTNNYVVWGERYYFLDDIVTRANGLYELVCSSDVMATYKDLIGAAELYIERSSARVSSNLFDKYMPMSTESWWSTRAGDAIPRFSGEGTYLVRTVGKSQTTSSIGITTYAMERDKLMDVLDFMFSTDSYDFMGDTLVQSFFNPFQYIVSVDWFPFTVPAFYPEGNWQYKEVRFGFWSSGYFATVVNTNYISFTLNVPLPPGQYGDFRDYSPTWTQLKLFAPGVGTVYLSPGEVQEDIDLLYIIDVATGQAMVNVRPQGRNYFITTLSGQFSSSVSIGQLQNNIRDTVSSASSAIGSLGQIFTNPLGALAGAIEGAVDVAADSAQPTPCYNGAAGNVASVLAYAKPQLMRLQYKSSDYPNAVLGRPYMRWAKISDVGGYIKTAGSAIPIPGLTVEKDQVNNYLNGGFYYE